MFVREATDLYCALTKPERTGEECGLFSWDFFFLHLETLFMFDVELCCTGCAILNGYDDTCRSCRWMVGSGGLSHWWCDFFFYRMLHIGSRRDIGEEKWRRARCWGRRSLRCCDESRLIQRREIGWKRTTQRVSSTSHVDCRRLIDFLLARWDGVGFRCYWKGRNFRMLWF